jgi:transposase-like protein
VSQRGQKHNDDIKEKAFAMLTECNNVSEVARKLGLKTSTVQTWKKQWENGDNGEFAKLREDKKKEFVDDAWNIIGKAQTLLERRLTRAIYSEDEIDKMVQVVVQDKDLTDESKKALLAKLRTIRVDDIREIATVLGTIYDKQALANKEATSIVDGGIQVEFNIPRPPKEDK